MSFLIASQKKNNLLILLLLLFCAAITYPSSIALIHEWQKWDQALSHGFACLALFVFFIWRQDFYIQTNTHSPTWILSIALLLNSIGWCFTQLGNLQLPGYIFALNNYGLLIAGFFGWRVAVALMPLLALFIFALPIWSLFTDILVTLSSKVVALVLGYTNLTLHVQDNQFMTPWGTIVIADGCSGLRYFIISLLIAYLLCLINPYSVKTKISIFIVAALLGLFTNWLRIIIIVLIGYYTEMQHSLVRDHEFFGWILFVCILFPALLACRQYPKNWPPLGIQTNGSWIFFVAALTGPAIYFATPFDTTNNPIKSPFVDNQQPAEPELQIQLPLADHHYKQRILLDNIVIDLNLSVSTPKNKQEKIVPFIGGLYDTVYWRSLKKVSGMTQSHAEILEARNNPTKVLLVHKFQVGSFSTPHYYAAKLLQIPARLFNQPYFGLWVAQSKCQSDCEQELIAMQKLDTLW
jgi:exosortase